MSAQLDFGLGETADMLRETVRRFAAEQIAPFAAEIDATNKFPRQLWPEMGALGLHGITVEEEFGGLGPGLSGACGGDGGDLPRLGLGGPELWRPFQSLRQPDPPLGQPGAEAPLSAQADFRRACRLAGHVGGGLGLRRGVDAAEGREARRYATC